MIFRYTNSFLFSILFHLFLVVAILFFCNDTVLQTKEQKKMAINLNCIVEKKQTDIKKNISFKPREKKSIPNKLKKIPKPKPKKRSKIIQKKAPRKKFIHVKNIKKTKKIPIEHMPTIASSQTKTAVLKKTPIKSIKPTEDYLQKHFSEIDRLLRENLYYPKSARRRGISGKVVVRFKLLKDATVQNVEVVSSKNNILGRSAVKTIQKLSGKFPKPKEDIIIKVPIGYRLLG